MAEYLSDPEKEPFYWDEPIMADNLQQARGDCTQKAKEYKVDLIDTVKASTKTRKRYLCKFRSYQ